MALSLGREQLLDRARSALELGTSSWGTVPWGRARVPSVGTPCPLLRWKSRPLPSCHLDCQQCCQTSTPDLGFVGSLIECQKLSIVIKSWGIGSEAFAGTFSKLSPMSHEPVIFPAAMRAHRWHLLEWTPTKVRARTPELVLRGRLQPAQVEVKKIKFVCACGGRGQEQAGSLAHRTSGKSRKAQHSGLLEPWSLVPRLDSTHLGRL